MSLHPIGRVLTRSGRDTQNSFCVYKEKRLCEDGDRGAWWVKVLSMRLQKSRGIIHWDLTLSNLLRNENQVKISDLGLSNE